MAVSSFVAPANQWPAKIFHREHRVESDKKLAAARDSGIQIEDEQKFHNAVLREWFTMLAPAGNA